MDFSKTILGAPYREDDRVLLMANFISEYLTSPEIEIEVKVGKFIFSEGTPPVSHISEIDLRKHGGRFESSIKPLLFYSLIDQLKQIYKDFTYQETEDSLYSCNEMDTKIRQTVGQDNQVLSLIKKSKIAEKNFLLNTYGDVIRISANKEEILNEIPENSRFSVIRKKKRHAFRYQYLEVDITDVEMNNKHSYELEIEIMDFNFVKNHVDNFVLGIEKGNLVGISRKIWQNALGLAFHKYKAPVPKVLERKDVFEEREKMYFEQIGEVRPVIGDYLYCISKETENTNIIIN